MQPVNLNQRQKYGDETELWSTHDNVVCKHIFPTLPCVQHHLFSRRPATVSRKADQRGGVESHGNVVVLVSKSFQVKVSASPPQKNERPQTQTLFCPPVCQRLSFPIRCNTAELWQPSFSSQSQLVILMSLLTAHTAESPLQTCRNVWEI